MRLRRPTVLLIFLIVSIVVLSTTLLADDNDVDNTKGDLDNIRNELESKRQHLKSLAKDEKSVLHNIRSIEENIDLTNAFVRKLNSTSTTLKQRSERLTTRIDSTAQELKDARSTLYLHLEHIYKRKRGRSQLAFLLAGSLSEAMREYHLSRTIIDYENDLLESIRLMIADVKAKKVQLLTNWTELNKVRKERGRELTTLERTKGTRTKLLSRVRKETKLQREAIANLEEEAKELERILEELRAAQPVEGKAIPDRKTAFYRLKKRLPWPVQGKVIASYGEIVHPVYKTKTFNPGIDISARYGTDVRASADGRVAYISYLRGYGNFIILDHGEGYYTLYGRLSEIGAAVDQQVLKGDVIGKVGDAGEGENPSLHFELRRGKKQYNPLKWLE